jgi:uncharacterized protein (UPF0332 family)
VIAAFGVHYAKTGIVPSEYHRFLTEALSLCHSGDYGQRESVTFEQAQEQIRRAERFMKMAEEQLREPPQEK